MNGTPFDPESGVKWCNACRQYRDVCMFSKSAGDASGLASYCKICMCDRDLKIKYGITFAQKEIMFWNQQGKCASCLSDLESVRKACVDHCHDSFVVRGLLCVTCNQVEGLLKKVNHVLHDEFLIIMDNNLKTLIGG